MGKCSYSHGRNKIRNNTNIHKLYMTKIEVLWCSEVKIANCSVRKSKFSWSTEKILKKEIHSISRYRVYLQKILFTVKCLLSIFFVNQIFFHLQRKKRYCGKKMCKGHCSVKNHISNAFRSYLHVCYFTIV